MPKATVVVPAYNVAGTIAETLRSLLRQTLRDSEIIVVDDGSKDNTLEIVASFDDPRLRVVRQANRGLAGAHNTGIAHAASAIIGFCDADDLWEPQKLERHVEHLEANPDVGISFSGSRLIDAKGRPTGLVQRPRLKGITAAHILKRNPIGNGSAAVMRKVALDAMAWRPLHEHERDWWFDETFRQTDDVEGWLRFALTTDWRIEGIPGLLTLYRINPGGLSANVERQYQTWERMVTKLSAIAPDFMERHLPAARAYQLRYLCRRAIAARDASLSLALSRRWLSSSWRPLLEEPVKSLSTLGAAALLSALGDASYRRSEDLLLSARRRFL